MPEYEFGARHDLIQASRSRGDIRFDIGLQTSIDTMFAKLGEIDANVSTVGDVHFSPFAAYNEDTFMLGLRNKVMGQVNLLLVGLPLVTDSGSFTLTSGIFDRDPIKMETGAAIANGALGGLVV